MWQGFALFLKVVKVYKGLLLITLNASKLSCRLPLRMQNLI
jgi:hypothetical protein